MIGIDRTGCIVRVVAALLAINLEAYRIHVGVADAIASWEKLVEILEKAVARLPCVHCRRIGIADHEAIAVGLRAEALGDDISGLWKGLRRCTQQRDISCWILSYVCRAGTLEQNAINNGKLCPERGESNGVQAPEMLENTAEGHGK